MDSPRDWKPVQVLKFMIVVDEADRSARAMSQAARSCTFWGLLSRCAGSSASKKITDPDER